jgi:hypothetical protein
VKALADAARMASRMARIMSVVDVDVLNEITCRMPAAMPSLRTIHTSFLQDRISTNATNQNHDVSDVP